MTLKYFRCGWCGCPVDSNDTPIPIGEIIMDVDWWKSELTHGNGCCDGPDDEYHQDIITREMAIDAGDPSLEGQPL